MPTMPVPNVVSWASDIEDQALAQAERTATMPFLAGHLALMPDAHWGMGSTVGSVIPTQGAIIPAAIGVDIGCGMVAVETNVAAGNLPDTLDPLLPLIAKAIPAGVGQGHDRSNWWLPNMPAPIDQVINDQKLARRAIDQFGSLGSGNHFVEVCLDERDIVWLVLHSGSRGVGNLLASRHIDGMAQILLLGQEVIFFSVTKTEQWATVMEWCESRLDASPKGGYSERELELAVRGGEMNRRGKGL